MSFLESIVGTVSSIAKRDNTNKIIILILIFLGLAKRKLPWLAHECSIILDLLNNLVFLFLDLYFLLLIFWSFFAFYYFFLGFFFIAKSVLVLDIKMFG
jgi:hypothetical protein